MAKARLIDVTKCTGCRGCQVLCKEWNENPAEETENWGSYENPPELSANTFIRVKFKEVEVNGKLDWLIWPVTCMHCTDASCVAACPTGAAHHEDGIVLIDQDICIGCGYCVQACPYGVPHKGDEGTARKCWLCLNRLEMGEQPACAKTCPPGAIQFGERGELISRAKQRVEYLKTQGYGDANLYGEDTLGGLHTLYVLAYSPSVYDIPEEPRFTEAGLLAPWLGGVAAAGVLAALPFWLLFRRREEMAGRSS